ncbi:MAG: DUF4838 domain-containing protein [Ruminococcaceae bacterium]|nr:DUF4838 domain-containing protein [Oscillospiraceae bacterium]
MSWFDKFLNKVEFIRPTYMVPFFVSLSLAISSLLSPLSGDTLTHKFEKPEEVPFAGETMEITEDYVIVISKDASPMEKNSAEKLNQYFEEMSGVSLRIVTDDAAETEKEIIIGKTNREGSAFTIDRTKLGDDGVVIKTVGEKIVLSGAEQRGTIYAVYTFLEEYFGCRWFTHDLIVVPKTEKLEIPKDIDYTYVPSIIFRETDWISPARSNEYKAANKLNDGVYGVISEEYGSSIRYAGTFAHTMGWLIDKAIFETEPEVFAYGKDNLKRTTDQLCLTNPRTLELAIQGVRSWLEQNPGAKIISVTQNDNQNYCVCSECKKIDREEGSQAGTMLRFVNAIADDIKEDYPDVLVDTFAYQYTRKPPKITVPRDNVVVRLCSIECGFSTPLDSGVIPENEKFVEDIRKWSEICSNLFVWDYTTNYRHYLAPFANFDVMQRNLQLFAENNVIGVYEEGDYTAAECDGEFAELRCYLLAKLMWDPYCDIDKHMYDFCEAYYGSGAQGIIDFINYMDENSGGIGFDMENWWITPIPNSIDIRNGLSIYAPVTSATVLRADEEDVAKIDAMWKLAKDGAETEEQLEHVLRSEMCWRYWKSCAYKGEFSNKDWDRRVAENENFYNDLVKFNIIRLCEGADGLIKEEKVDFASAPDRWK